MFFNHSHILAKGHFASKSYGNFPKDNIAIKGMLTRKRWTTTSTPEGQDAAVSKRSRFYLLASSNRPIPQFNQSKREAVKTCALQGRRDELGKAKKANKVVDRYYNR